MQNNRSFRLHEKVLIVPAEIDLVFQEFGGGGK